MQGVLSLLFNVWFLLAGVISGIVAGMGMGGGTLLIPILTIFLAVPQITAQSMNLLVFIPMAIVTIVIHFKNKLVDFKSGLPIIIGGVISSTFASILANNISNNLLRLFFGMFLLAIGVWQLICFFISLKNKNKKVQNNSKYKFTFVFK